MAGGGVEDDGPDTRQEVRVLVTIHVVRPAPEHSAKRLELGFHFVFHVAQAQTASESGAHQPPKGRKLRPVHWGCHERCKASRQGHVKPDGHPTSRDRLL